MNSGIYLTTMAYTLFSTEKTTYIMCKKWIFSIALASALLAGTTLEATAQTNTMSSMTDKSTGKDLAASAGLSADHSTLLAALKEAGLADRATGAGPYTVFAPTNAAFDKLPAGTVDMLLKPESKGKLTSILTTHVVSGSVMSSDLKDGQKIKTVNGETLTVMMQGGKVMIKDAKGGMATVTMADIKATNGVVHSIDTVLMPMK